MANYQLVTRGKYDRALYDPSSRHPAPPRQCVC